MKFKLHTDIMKKMVSKMITKVICENSGIDTDIQLNELDIDVVNGEMTIRTNVEIKIDTDEFKDLVKMYC